MLILTRKRNESIIINDNIEVVVIEAEDGRVKLGINAPKSVKVHRKEVYESIISENVAATQNKVDVAEFKRQFKQNKQSE
ncbi:MAG: carbon storage regulator [Clostridiales bacterium]|nr:MAG: carbon storage regulator [Clostridiales bacterium]